MGRPSINYPTKRHVPWIVAWSLLAVRLAVASTNAQVTFRYSNSVSTQVALAAEFTDWRQVPMKRGGDGVWQYRVALPPGEFLYNFIVVGPSGKPGRPKGINPTHQ